MLHIMLPCSGGLRIDIGSVDPHLERKVTVPVRIRTCFMHFNIKRILDISDVPVFSPDSPETVC